MRILVYGAGVIGCELAHELFRGGNDVTLLARGDWKRTIDEKGLVIFHYGQLHTTIDHIKTIDRLKKEDRYDLIFVVMKYNQTISILSELSANESMNIILVGNNMNLERCREEIVEKSSLPKELAFGFIGIGGVRKVHRVVSMHFRPEVTIGGARGSLSNEFEQKIKEAFLKTKCKLSWENNMEEWLFTHIAHVLPTCYLCYHYGFNLKRASKEQINMAVKANIEAHQLLSQLGYSIQPVSEEIDYRVHPKKRQRILYIIAKTFVGKCVISNHCRNAIDEMSRLDADFEQLRALRAYPMPAWDSLRRSARSVLESVNHEKYAL